MNTKQFIIWFTLMVIMIIGVFWLVVHIEVSVDDASKKRREAEAQECRALGGLPIYGSSNVHIAGCAR